MCTCKSIEYEFDKREDKLTEIVDEFKYYLNNNYPYPMLKVLWNTEVSCDDPGDLFHNWCCSGPTIERAYLRFGGKQEVIDWMNAV